MLRESQKRRMDPAIERKGDEDITDQLSSIHADDSLLNLHDVQNWRVLKHILNDNNVYRLLGFVPFGIVAGLMGLNPTAVFVFNLLAVVPLAVLLSAITEDLSKNCSQSIGALLNATFGNALELIVSTVALTRGEIRIVQANMLGAILSNLLLGLGSCFLVGGFRRDCRFNATAAQTMGSLMVVASMSLVIPAALNMAFDHTTMTRSPNDILVLSRGTSIVLLILYVTWLYFQFQTHSRLFEQTNANVDSGHADARKGKQDDALSPQAAGIALLTTTIMIAVCAEYLVSTIDGLVHTLGINKIFVGLIILPLVGNAPEQVTAVAAAAKNEVDLALGVALGSSLQIALFVTPFLVVVGWIINQPMSLCFEPFDAVVFFLSVLVVNSLIADGETNYLEGAMLVGTYAIIGTAFYVYPEDHNSV
ncbi:hypothetical protein N7G274_010104 [Stereocaulon virgatum]|uniref:Vacuolar calcium ion transporter n=1 Tax=Stereocaulon virgatum TaxID=373712 RepID=A0ABR3ZV03_9LECA